MNTPGDRELTEAEQGRGIPQVGRARRGNKWLLLFLIAAAVVLAISLGVHQALGNLRSRNTGKEEPKGAAPALPTMTRDAFAAQHQAMPELPAPTDPKAPPPPAVNAPLTPEQQAALQLASRRRHAPLLATVHQGSSAEAAQGQAFAQPGAAAGAGARTGGSSLGNALTATRGNAVSASVLAHPHLTITEGTFIDCVLVTAINSQQPGMTSCMLTRDIYSTDGQVLLLEKGSRVVGQYQSAQLRQGLDRIFVLWTRVETPQGIVVNIDSPSTDQLGRSGADGVVNNHFWARFGSALLISFVNDIGQYESAKQQGGGNTLNLGSSAAGGSNDAVSTILQNTVNIPPTLDKAQGGHISIFVSRDLDFSNVYQLATTPSSISGAP
jgi:type IV secretion system protein VirB10